MISGLHHVTAIASDPQRNLNFYVGLLGLRLVKRTINFDDPGTYHFYFGDGRGTPGTILTFFPWPAARRGSSGTGQVETTAFAIAPESVGYWVERLTANQVSAERPAGRFGEEVIRFPDPDGMALELVASPTRAAIDLFQESSVPQQHALRGFHGVSAALEGYERTAKLLTETFGYQLMGKPETASDSAVMTKPLPEDLSTSSACPTASGAAAGLARFTTSHFASRMTRSSVLGGKGSLTWVTTSAP